MAFAPLLVPTPRSKSGLTATPGVGTSTFTPGTPSADNAPPARVAAHHNTRMAAAVNNTSRSAAAAALAAAGGVDPNSHHVTATLRHHVNAPADAASADKKRLARLNGVTNWAPTPIVKCSTAAGGGWSGDAAAVARDTEVKRAAWAAEMAALRSGSSVPATVGASTVPVVTTAATSRPQSVTVTPAPRVAMTSWAARQARLSLHAEGSTAEASTRKERSEPSAVAGSSPTDKVEGRVAVPVYVAPSEVASAATPVPEPSPLEVAAASLAAFAVPSPHEAVRTPAAQRAPTPSQSGRTPTVTPAASQVPAATSKSLIAVLSPPVAPSPVETAAASLAAVELSPLERAAASLVVAANASPAVNRVANTGMATSLAAKPERVQVTTTPVTKAAVSVGEVTVPEATTAALAAEIESAPPKVVHVRSAWGAPRTPVPRQVVHVRPSWGKPRTVTVKATAPPTEAVTPRVVHVRSAWGARRSYIGSPRVPRASPKIKMPVSASAPKISAPVMPARSMPTPAIRPPVLASTSAARSSTVPGTNANAPAEKVIMPSYVTAAMTGASTLSPETDVSGADNATMPIALRTIVPPAVAAAFVGACLALSHASAVIGAGLPLN
ncbi:hypothetical protein MMPV_005217 [Pyropia vietnamensis]